MNQDPVTIKRIQWSSVFPGLLLFRAMRIACSVQVIIPCVLLIVLCSSGQLLINDLVQSPPVAQAPFESQLFSGGMAKWHAQPSLSVSVITGGMRLLTGIRTYFLHDVLQVLWFVISVSLVGTATARVASNSVAGGTRTGAIRSLLFSCRLWKSSATAAGISLLLMVVLLALNHVAGWIVGIPGIGHGLYALLLPLTFLLAVITVLAALVLSIAWLLSLGAVGTDQCGGADALSRSISYVLTHPLRSVVYCLIVGLVAMAGRWLMNLAFSVAGVLVLTYSVDGPARLVAPDQPPELSTYLTNVWMWLIAQIPQAYQLGIMLTGMCLAYLLLRQQVDGIRLDEQDGGPLPSRGTVSSGGTALPGDTVSSGGDVSSGESGSSGDAQSSGGSE
jgi:hypothetical protein